MTALIFVLCATCHFETAKEIFHDGYFLVQVDAVSEYVPGEKDQFGTFIIQVLAIFQSECCVLMIAHSIAFILLKMCPRSRTTGGKCQASEYLSARAHRTNSTTG